MGEKKDRIHDLVNRIDTFEFGFLGSEYEIYQGCTDPEEKIHFRIDIAIFDLLDFIEKVEAEAEERGREEQQKEDSKFYGEAVATPKQIEELNEACGLELSKLNK